jgi:tetrapyrrole methylase family protein/MazG family protein
MQALGTVTVIDLGPAGAELLSRKAWDALLNATRIYVLDRLHPAITELPDHLEIVVLLAENENIELDDLCKRLIAEALEGRVVNLALAGGAAGTILLSCLKAQAAENGLEFAFLPAIDPITLAMAVFDLDLGAGLSIAHANQLADLEVPNFNPTQPVLVRDITEASSITDLKLSLMAVYPDEWQVKLLHDVGLPSESIEGCQLWQIDRSMRVNSSSILYIPPLASGASLEDFQQIIAKLRSPEGCPWDRQQTHLSLRPNLLEEAYEVLEALDEEDMSHLKEELGDLLLQIVLHAQIANEDQDFTLNDVLQGISEKLVRRHPHVFGDTIVDDVEGVTQTWEKIKASERKNRGETNKGILDGIPKTLPALTQAQQIQKRAKRVGFDWYELEPVVAKLQEEIQEFLEADTAADRNAEAGDLLFAAVNLIRWLDIDPEMALRDTNERFRKRFSYIEAKAREQGKSVQELGFAKMDVLWEEAKVVFAQGQNRRELS